MKSKKAKRTATTPTEISRLKVAEEKAADTCRDFELSEN
jgi:hypothetical protein